MDLQQQYLQGEYRARLSRVLAYIDQHLAERLSLEVLAGVAFFSPYHFHRIFAALTGETLNRYIRRLRLEKAAMTMDLRPRLSITEVALDSGFASSATFARAFKEHFGLSPSTWRRAAAAKKSRIGKTNSKAGQDSPPGAGYASSQAGRLEGETLSGGERMDLKVEVKEMPAFEVAYVRHMTGYNEGIGQAFEKLFRWAGPRGLLSPRARVLGVPLDDPEVTPADKCRFDACLTVPQGTEPGGEIGIKVIPGGTHAVARYQGPGDGRNTFYNALYGQWLPRSGYEPLDSPAYELYLGGPGGGDECRAEEKHVFDLCLPVKPL